MTPRLVTALLLGLIPPLVLGDPSWSADAAAGQTLFDANCAACHGVGGQGDGPVGAALNPAPRDLTTGEFKFDADETGLPGEDEDIKLVIQNGAMEYGGSALMAPWPTLSDDQIVDLVAYIRSLEVQSAEP